MLPMSWPWCGPTLSRTGYLATEPANWDTDSLVGRMVLDVGRKKWSVLGLAGSLSLAVLASGVAVGATAHRENTACSLLSESQASMDLGGHVVRQNSTPTFCLYERSNKEGSAVLSVTVLFRKSVWPTRKLSLAA